MDQQQVFSNAKWVCAGEYSGNSQMSPDPIGTPFFPILRSHFTLNHIKKATLRVLGLGFFHCYINGTEITEDTFLPLSTNYEPQENYPIDERQTGHRIYVPEYDVTELVCQGENVLALHFGGGWYTTDGGRWCPDHVPFGTAKAIYRLTVETADGTVEFVSSENDKIGGSYVKTYDFFSEEHQDYSDFDDACLCKDYDDSSWSHALPAPPVHTNYLFTDCPADRVRDTLEVTLLHTDGEEQSYDCGLNCAAYPVLKLTGNKGEKVTVLFAEERNEDGTPDLQFHYWQTYTCICDGTERIVHPMFTWFAFRYFKVIGPAEVLCVKAVNTDVKVNSSFTCDNETLNWIYKAYLNTQLNNMHTGIPSDCPHIERKGYTGDGQLTCHAAMTTMDAQRFYKKWIGDISDCQDLETGHIQYTAPYYHCGGGPGGWGCAIIEVPYQYYKHYGDAEPLHQLYGQMLRYFDYLEAHSENDLVVSDKAGNWCLGDWCPPVQVILPAPFVNNYFYIKSLQRMIEIASLTGHGADISMFEKRIETRRAATKAAYFNSNPGDSNCLGCLQGANAFALDMGIGDQLTYDNMVKYYRMLGHYDTGIFGTDILTRLLFKNGDGDLAVDLLTSTHQISFEGMRRAGATTIWENWPGATWDRSRNHPMFGAVAAYLFDYLLGIQHTLDSITVAPVLVQKLNTASGHRSTPLGEVAVSYEKHGDTADFTITIPSNVPATFTLGNVIMPLHAGKNLLHSIPVPKQISDPSKGALRVGIPK